MLSQLPLLDWLYTIDNKNQPKQGALIVFPQMIDRWNIASMIVSSWDRYRVVVITDQPDDFMQTIIDTSSNLNSDYQSDWKHIDTIPFRLIKYSQLDEINKALHNTEVDIILFDDARMLATISPGLIYDDIKPQLIVLTSWGDTKSQLDLITSYLPNLSLLSINLISDTSSVEWKKIVVPMTARQFYYYSEVRYRELRHSQESNTFQLPYSTSRMLTLYTYPESIMADTLAHRSICETDQTTYPDQLNNQTWLNPDVLRTLEEDGPKLSALIDGIISHWPLKQIVLTRFNHRYGVDLITSMVQLLTDAQQNPYELDEIYHISCTDNYEDTINRLHKFNQATSGILITNIVPLIPLHDVSVIHVADSYSFPTLMTLIDRCHKRYLNQNQQNLVIYSYLASIPPVEFIESESADQFLYNKLIEDLSATNQVYTGLIRNSRRIVYDSEHGLLVI
jgi:hypothetical protein